MDKICIVLECPEAVPFHAEDHFLTLIYSSPKRVKQTLKLWRNLFRNAFLLPITSTVASNVRFSSQLAMAVIGKGSLASNAIGRGFHGRKTASIYCE